MEDIPLVIYLYDVIYVCMCICMYMYVYLYVYLYNKRNFRVWCASFDGCVALCKLFSQMEEGFIKNNIFSSNGIPVLKRIFISLAVIVNSENYAEIWSLAFQAKQSYLLWVYLSILLLSALIYLQVYDFHFKNLECWRAA